jgi:hypothetical protein
LHSTALEIGEGLSEHVEYLTLFDVQARNNILLGADNLLVVEDHFLILLNFLPDL